MMNNDNSITLETKLYGYIAENAQSSRFCAVTNKTFRENGINAMIVPMNIRPDDVAYTITQMRTSKLSGAVIASEYQEEAFGLCDASTDAAAAEGYCDLIRIAGGKLQADLISPAALVKYAEHPDFTADVALMATSRYFYELVTGENR